MHFQRLLLTLQDFWARQGCVLLTPYHTEVGAGTSNPSTFLRVLGPEPWSVAYIEPSIRPTDGRYGENPNRMQHYHQFQVILKPSPENVQDLFLQSLEAIGLDLTLHDFRFVEDNWQSPSLGAWGVGWEAWLDGMEILQFTYFQECGGQKLRPKACELTYGLERIATYIQGKDSVWELEWAPGVTYRDVFHQSEVEFCRYNFEEADQSLLFATFERYEAEAGRLLGLGLIVPAYDHCLKLSHLFNLLDARGSFSAAERGRYLLRTRAVAQGCAEAFVEQRAKMGHPLLGRPAQRPSQVAPHSSSSPSSPQPPLTAPADFLLEVGVEELPHGHLAVVREHLPRLVERELDAAGLPHGAVTCFDAPRRFAVLVKDLAPRQADRVDEVRGPKRGACTDASGAWTMAARKFAEAHGADPDGLVFREQGKAEYAFLTKNVSGRSLDELVSPLVAAVLKGLPFPKAMTWEDGTFPFSRPVRWLLALHGERLVPVEVELRSADEVGPAVVLRSDRVTWGHRRLAPGALTVASPAAYRDALRKAFVLVDRSERRQKLVADIHELARSRGLVFDEGGEAELVDEVVDLVEMGHPMVGTIPAEALSLPEEIVTTPMRVHQRYFPLRKGDGSLSGHFVCVANGAFRPEAGPVIVDGNEKVLNARLRDARFFWDGDRERTLDQHAERLGDVVFHQKLGSYAEKVARLQGLSSRLADALPPGVDPAALTRVLHLMKADLTTQMVFEFTSLEGLVGSLYARAEGLPEPVAQAIFEHRLPRRADDALPSSPLGAAAGLLDRMDSLAGYLALGQRPTGSRDPMGLRRLVLAFLAVAEKFDLDVDLQRWCREALAGYSPALGFDFDTVAADLVDFASERAALAAKEAGAPHDLVQAAVAPHRSRPRRFRSCLSALRSADETLVQALAEHAKRMGKIATEPAETLDPALFEYPTEKALAALLPGTEAAVRGAVEEGDFTAALKGCGALIEPVVAFFTEVLVNAEDAAVRRNRHRLVAATGAVLLQVADFGLVEKKG